MDAVTARQVVGFNPGVLCGSWHDAAGDEIDDGTLDDPGLSACIHAAQDEETCNNCNPDGIYIYDDEPNPQWIVQLRAVTGRGRVDASAIYGRGLS